ncbi:MAG: efflux transporter outer membrane subunit [Phycisphaerae bacterium]|nr:efflux transporter outer membrane subunit [Phycisphaerae bacterium]
MSGCKVGPDYTAPDADVNASWLADAAPAAANPRWWESFEDPTLTSLIETSASQNLTLRAAGLRVIEARAVRSIAVGRFFPQSQAAAGSVSASQLSQNSALGQGADRSFSESFLGLEAAWELDFWGKFRRGIEASDADLLASVADYDAVLVTVIADVATNYILLRSFQERLAIAESNVNLQRQTLDLTEVRFRSGAVSELDVATARATLTDTQALIPEFKDAIDQLRLSLCVLLGRAPSELQAELAPSTTGSSAGVARVPQAPVQIAAGVPAELLRRRPDVRQAERLAAAQSARIGVATADLFPQISINGVTGFASSTFEGSRNPNLGNMFDADSFTGFIGLRVNWPILNYGRITGNIRAQDARYEQAVAAYQESVIRAASDVESGFSTFLRAAERAALLRESVSATRRSFDLSFMQYSAGLVDFIRLNDAQVRLEQQEDNLVEARTRIALGAVQTFRALGGGWEIREGREFIDAETARRMRERTNWGNVLAPDWHEGKDGLFFDRPPLDKAAPTEQPAGSGTVGDAP